MLQSSFTGETVGDKTIIYDWYSYMNILCFERELTSRTGNIEILEIDVHLAESWIPENDFHHWILRESLNYKI